MHCDPTTRHASGAPRGSLASSPIDTYRNYRRALRSRDLGAILQNLAGFAAQRLLAFGDPAAFGPSLSVWCAIEAEAISKAFGVAINGDRAIVQAGGKHTCCLLHMSRSDDAWRIVAEEHARRRRGAIAFQSRSLDLFGAAPPGAPGGVATHFDVSGLTIVEAVRRSGTGDVQRALGEAAQP